MANAYYGKTILGELSDAQAFPNAAAVDSTNMIYVGGKTGGSLWINVYANTAITIATGQAFNIEFQSYSADTAASATSFITSSNGGATTSFATGTTLANATVTHYLFSILYIDLIRQYLYFYYKGYG